MDLIIGEAKSLISKKCTSLSQKETYGNNLSRSKTSKLIAWIRSIVRGFNGPFATLSQSCSVLDKFAVLYYWFVLDTVKSR
jgi:hypothetical protein